MKIFTLLLIAACLSLSSIVMAQGIPCPIPCWKESFPYWFCTATGGVKVVECSTNPDSMPGLIATKTHLPGRVTVVPVDTSLWFQPIDPVPLQPEPVSLPDTYDVFESCLANAQDYGDTSIVNAGVAEWDTDFAQVHEGHEPNVPPDESNYETDEEYNNALDTYNCDREDYTFFTEDVERYDTYIGDSISYANGTDVHYVQIFSSGDASSDALSGLNAWLAVCGLTGDATCPIFIHPDTNPQNWQGNYVATPGHPISHALGITPALGTYCNDGLSCADSTKRFIIYNAMNSFFYSNNKDIVIVNQGYINHPKAPLVGWFIGTASPITYVDPNYSSFTFRDMVEHEEGHFLTMNHPERLASDSASCVNNQTACLGDLTPMLMSTVGIGVNNVPQGLQPDDKCMFEKLYCPGTRDDGVEDVESPEPPSPEIFPNPTTGACQLQYEVMDRVLVQVAIYDMLGKEVRDVMNDYSSDGQQTISLGTETLPSGSYVCRVRVGDRVSYINLAITK
jgi:hypothetical protein